MPSFLPGDPLVVNNFPRTQLSTNDNTETNADLNWRAGTQTVTTTFIAPTTERVWIDIAVTARSTSGTFILFVHREIRENDSSGAVISAPNSLSGVRMPLNTSQGGFTTGYIRLLETILAAEQQYFCRMEYMLSAAGSCEIRNRRLYVSPAT